VLKDAGYDVRALIRGAPPAGAPADITWVRGDLDNQAALAELVNGVSAVVHLAGAIKALSAWEFMAVNVSGTVALAEAAAGQSNPPRFIHVSSLAAREPHLSPYAASKAAAEAAVRTVSPRLPVIILRPPAVYGPGDPETLRIFKMAARGFLPVPPNRGCRLSLAHVDDAAGAILATLRLPQVPAETLEFDDGNPRGHTWGEVAIAAGAALNRPIRTVMVPAFFLYVVGSFTYFMSWATRRPNVITHQKVAEMLHPDWVVRSPAIAGYHPAWTLAEGFKNTAEWAESQGLVRILHLS